MKFRALGDERHQEGCFHLVAPPPHTATAKELQGGGESSRRRAGQAGSQSLAIDRSTGRLGVAQGTFCAQAGQGDHCP